MRGAASVLATLATVLTAVLHRATARLPLTACYRDAAVIEGANTT